MLRTFCCVFLASSQLLFTAPDNPLLEDLKEQDVVVQMQNPVYEDGVLHSDEGGIIVGTDFRLQAQSITYSQTDDTHTVNATGDLMLEYGGRVFIGDSITYDFSTKSGEITEGRSAIDPWYVGGEKIELHPDRSFTLHDGFVTTSHDLNTDWQLRSSYAKVHGNNILSARNVQFRFVKIPLFWVPAFRVDLNDLFDAPLRYKLSHGGSSGVQLSLRYRIWTWDAWKLFLRMDYRLRRGFGGGLEMEYVAKSGHAAYFSRLYWANDGSLFSESQRTRYRVEGTGFWLIQGDPNYSVDYRYDKLSDEDMASDYHEREFDLKTAGRTELLLRRKKDHWILTTNARGRVNRWQTIKEELPKINLSHRPFQIGQSGVIFSNEIEGGYVGFSYADNIPAVKDFSSSRLQWSPRFTRSFRSGPLFITPVVGGEAIFYGSSQNSSARLLATGVLDIDSRLHFHRLNCDTKYLQSPYLTLRYRSDPSTNPDDHYTFDINDGWYRILMIDIGHSFAIYKRWDCHAYRLLETKLWVSRFFGANTIARKIPRLHGQLQWNPGRHTHHSLSAAWDFERAFVDHINARSELTLSEDLALAVEYRRRSAFHWRKVDRENFALDFFRSEDALQQSTLSDRRDTLLSHLFYRLNEAWWMELRTRSGWRRRDEPGYLEWELGMSTIWSSAWRVQLTYQSREHDKRVSLNLSLRDSRPERIPFERVPKVR